MSQKRQEIEPYNLVTMERQQEVICAIALYRTVTFPMTLTDP